MEGKINEKDDKKTPSPESAQSWLQRLKQESWEAELLVSTISIFGTFQLFNLVGWVSDLFIDILHPDQYRIGYFIVFFGLLAISILISMFVIHFFLRAYWIGLVGLNSVFPDYSIKDSAYSEIYTKKILAILPKLKDSIQKVDELCSVIFSVAFTSLLMYLYIGLFSSMYLLVFNLLSPYVPTYILLIPLIVMAIGLVVQLSVGLLANMKSNRQKEKLQLWNFKISRLAFMMSYGPLYKSILQVSMIFGSNFKKKKHLIYLIILFLISGVLVSVSQIFNTNIPYLITRESFFDQTKAYSSFYKTENKNNDFLLTPEIESDQVATKVLKLFIPIFRYEKKMGEKVCGTFIKDANKSKAEQRKERQAHLIECYPQYNLVFLNGKETAVDFLRYNHPKTGQSGIITYLDLSGLKTGLNRLEVKKKFGEEVISDWSIPFYFME